MAPGAMKWVPVNRDEPAKPEKAAKPEKQADAGEKQAKGGSKSEGKGAGKPDFKGASKGAGSKGSGKAETKGSSNSEWKAAEWKGGGGAGKGDDRWDRGHGDDRYDRGKGGNKGDDRGTWDYREKGYGDDRNSYKVEHRGDRKGDFKGSGKGATDAKGKGKAGGKGKGSRKGRDDSPPAQPRGAKTVQELEAELAKNPAGRGKDRDRGDRDRDRDRVHNADWRPRGPDALGKQPIAGEGAHCTVHKHSGMGVAVVSMETAQSRETVMNYVENKPGAVKDSAKLEIGRVMAQLRRHTDKSTQRDVPTDIFLAWGHRAEKESPLEADVIADAFDKVFIEAQNAGVNARMQAPSLHVPGSQLGATLSTTPQQLVGGRQPAVPPPPMHLPTVGPHGVPMAAQAPVHPAYHEYAQRAAMYNQYGYGGYAGAHQYGYPPPQHHQMYAQHQAAYAHDPHYQQHLQHQQYLQHLQLQQQQQAAQAPRTPQHMQAAGDALTSPASAAAQGVVAVGTLSTAAPMTPTRGGAAGSTDGSPADPGSGGSGSGAKPRLLQIMDPNTGQPIDTLNMNFEPRKPSTPMAIKNPATGEAVKP